MRMLLKWIKSLICIPILTFMTYNVVSAYDSILSGTTTNFLMSFPQPDSLHITSGKGWIIIFFNGKIELKNTNLDEASEEFWHRMVIAFPAFKQNIIDGYKKELKNIEK